MYSTGYPIEIILLELAGGPVSTKRHNAVRILVIFLAVTVCGEVSAKLLSAVVPPLMVHLTVQFLVAAFIGMP